MAISKSTLERLVAKNEKPKIGPERLQELIAANKAKIEGRSPEIVPDDEGLQKITERAVATTTARTTPECITACISGEVTVSLYCGQILKGPDLSDLHPLTISNIGRQWARQSIRCISESVLEHFHPGLASGQRSILPLNEAQRLLDIVSRRLKRGLEGGAEEFWRQARQELEDYISSWDDDQKAEAINSWK